MLARSEQRDYRDAVDAVSVMVIALPAMRLATVVNVAWLAKALLDISRRQRYLAIYALGATIVLWVITMFASWLFG